ncbi:dienelactone hydrolase family protein [Cryobacterium sp. SO1]|uniref:dienelactone hydrolase family protein n=1 Tax=Cryobacterium sp. SO1 TaxID=1897061 RepID=UPI0010238D12|nr:alpha/beta fold hydrolase [Cryobacterium sp. SO1]RZI35817.1 hypothetical protein BJQ95_01791 [Cryobacterium sp. SO1]
MAELPHDRRAIRDLLEFDEPEQYRPLSVQRRPIAGPAGMYWERVEIVSADGDVIPCFLLIPEEPTGSNVIALHQHAGSFALGKSEAAGLNGDRMLAYGPRLCKQGARVLIPDLLGFEERQRAWSSDPAADESLDALLRISNGGSLQAKHTRDIATITTWMIESFGDDQGIGVMGHSLGGQVALFNLAVDPRLTIGVVSCGLGTLASFEAHHIKHNPAWFVPGLATAGDVPCVAAALHQQQVLVTAGIDDPLFPLEGVHAVLAAFEAGVCTAELFVGGHELPPRLEALAIRHLTAEC